MRRSLAKPFLFALFSISVSQSSIALGNCEDSFWKSWFGKSKPTITKNGNAEAKIPPPEISAWEKNAAELRRIRDLPNGAEKTAAIRAYSRPSPKTWKTKAWVLGNYAMSLATLGMATKGFITDPYQLLLAIQMQPATLYFADVSSQVFHKWLDSIAHSSGKVWGPVVDDFRKHHEYPNNLNEEPYLDNISDFGLPMAPAFAANLAATFFLPPSVSTSVNTWLLATMNTPETHKQAHLGSKASPLFKKLQKYNITVSNKDHMAHHKAPFDDNFSVFNGWFNPMAKRLNLWDRWDRRLWKTTKRLPNTWIQDPRAIPEDILEELKRDPKLIPNELWGNGEVYPYRVPENMKDALGEAKETWRAEFILRRRMLFQEASVTDQSGKTEMEYENDWLQEQKEYDWIYGDKPIPLFDKI